MDTLAGLPRCDVCERPVPALTPARHILGVMLCADCLVTEVEIITDTEEA